MTWVEQEPGVRAAMGELARLRRRAFARPLRPLLYALVITGALVGMRARKVSSFSARVVLRVTEVDLDATTAPRPAQQLREYLREIALGSDQLLEVIRDHGLYPRELERDPSLAVEALRSDLEVDVWRTDSARIGLSYRSDNPDRAVVVVQHLARLLSERKLEQSQPGLLFEVTDPARAARPGSPRPRELVTLAAILFALLLPLAGIAAGAFDSRIYDAQDVRRLGLEAVGHLDPFPGDNVGTLEARLARDRGIQ